MTIYRGDTPLKAYKGDYKPVNIYKGNVKVAGWHAQSVSGDGTIALDGAYNVPPDALTFDGKCVQTGTPSPSSSAPITTVGNLAITATGGGLTDTASAATVRLCSLPDGTKDTYDAVTGVLTRRVGKIVLNGSEVWGLASEFDTINGVSIYSPNIINPASSGNYAPAICDKLKTGVTSLTQQVTDVLYAGPTIAIINVNKSHLATYNVAGVKAWLAANPVTVYYKLATPTTEQLTPDLPVIRTGIKSLSVSGDVTPTIHATVKAMD